MPVVAGHNVNTVNGHITIHFEVFFLARIKKKYVLKQGHHHNGDQAAPHKNYYVRSAFTQYGLWRNL